MDRRLARPFCAASRHLAACLLVVATGCAGLRLPPAGVVGGPSPEQVPDAGAVVLEDEATLEYRNMALADGRRRLVAVLDHRRKLKLLRPDGAVEANVRLPLDGESTVTRVVARAISPEGRVTNMAPEAVWAEAQPGAGRAAPEMQLLAFDVPGTQPGGAVEYRYERVYLDPWNVPPWVFGGRLPTVRATFGVVSPEGMRVDLAHGRGERTLDRQPAKRDVYGGRQRLIFREDDLPGYFAAPHAVHLARRAPWLAAQLRSARVDGEAVRMTSWDDVGAHLQAQLAKVGAQPDDAPTLRRLDAIRHELVTSPEVGFGGRAPQAAEALAKGTLACSRDAAAYALGRLGGAGPRVRLLLATGPEAPPLRPDFPALYPFRRAALALQFEASWRQKMQCEGPGWRRDFLCGAKAGDWVYFAPDCPDCPLGVVPAGYAGARALQFDDTGKARFVTLDAGDAERHALSTEARLTMDVAGELTGTLDAEAHGLMAARWRAALGRPAGAPEGPAAASHAATAHYRSIYGDGRGPRAENITVRGVDDTDRGLWAHAQLNVRAPRLPGDTYTLRVDDLTGESIPPSWRPERQQAAVLEGPSWHESLVLVTLPLGVEAAARPPLKLVHEAAEYAAGFVQHGRTLKFSRRFVLKAAQVRPEAWASFQDFFARVRAYEHTPLPLHPAQ